MWDQFSRTALLLGEAGMERLQRVHIAVFGLGGVGGWAAEALARSGVGTLTLVDDDRIGRSNLNRQVFALTSTIGRDKAEAARDRLLDINPEAAVKVWKVFYGPDTAGDFDFTQYTYVVDAIDTVTGKLALIEQARTAGTRIISCMGAGNKLDPAAFRVADIYETSVCPLARVMRKELKRRGIRRLKVVYSQEPPQEPEGVLYQESLEGEVRRQVPGSSAFVPAAAGLILAGEGGRDLALGEGQPRESVKTGAVFSWTSEKTAPIFNIRGRSAQQLPHVLLPSFAVGPHGLGGGEGNGAPGVRQQRARRAGVPHRVLGSA